MAQNNGGFTPYVIEGGGDHNGFEPSTFLNDPELIVARDNYLDRVRAFARSAGRERLDSAREKVRTDTKNQTPDVVKTVIDALRERVSDGFSHSVVKNGDYTNLHSLDKTFAGLSMKDVSGFFASFEESLTRFYSYGNLAASIHSNRPLEVKNKTAGVPFFEDLPASVRKDIGSELLAEGFYVLSRMRTLGYQGTAECASEDTPVSFYSADELDTLFDALEAIQAGEIGTPEDFPTIESAIEEILDDPEFRPGELLKMILSDPMRSAETSGRPVNDVAPLRAVPNGRNVAEGTSSVDVDLTSSTGPSTFQPQAPERHLTLVRS